MTNIKKCTRCKVLMGISEFHRDSSRRDGLSYRCKECSAMKKRGERGSIKYGGVAPKDVIKLKLYYRHGVVYNKFTGNPVGYHIKNGRKMVNVTCGKKKHKNTMAYIVCVLHDIDVPDGWHIHHKDCDKSNDTIENLVVWPAEFHTGWHSKQSRYAPACIDLHKNHIEWMLDKVK